MHQKLNHSMLTPQFDLLKPGLASSVVYDKIKNIILLHTIDQSEEAEQYIILKSESVRIEYSENYCGATVDWFNFYTGKKFDVDKKLEDLMNQLQQNEAVRQKVAQGYRLTIHTRVEKKDSDLSCIADDDARGDYILLDKYSYYIAELRLDWSTPNLRCLPFKY